MNSVLVTGGTGFIGSPVAKWIVKAGYRVVVPDDLLGDLRRTFWKAPSL